MDPVGRAMTRTEPLPLRPDRGRVIIEQLEREAIALLHALKAHNVPGSWHPSPLEDRYLRLREALIETEGVLRGFRHSFLVGGRANFPDIPRPKTMYLSWNGGIPRRQKWSAGILRMLTIVQQLARRQHFRLADLDDTLVGEPSVYRVPKGASALGLEFARRLPGLRSLSPPPFYAITEAQLRFFYYRRRIQQQVGHSIENVLEVGAGYGGLAAELLQHIPIRRYIIVELPDAVPVAYFYLRACFACPIQVLYRAEDRADPSARIILLPPWKLPDLDGTVDLFVNTMSLQHMLPESVAFYLSQAERLKTLFFYLVNRDIQRDPTDVIISEYPIPAHFALVDKRAYPFEPHLEMVYKRSGEPNRMVNAKIDTERRTAPSEGAFVSRELAQTG